VVNTGKVMCILLILLFVLLFPVSKNRVAAKRIGNNVVNTWLIMEFGPEFLNNHPPIENALRLDVPINQLQASLIIFMNRNHLFLYSRDGGQEGIRYALGLSPVDFIILVFNSGLRWKDEKDNGYGDVCSFDLFSYRCNLEMIWRCSSWRRLVSCNCSRKENVGKDGKQGKSPVFCSFRVRSRGIVTVRGMAT
jgi:hypothetical protein